MKHLLFTLTVFLSIISCQSEKELQKISPDEADRIKQKSGVDLTSNGMFGQDPYYYKNTARFKGEATEAARNEARNKFNEELNQYQIPRLNEAIVANFLNWQNFEQFCRDKKNIVSSRTNQYLAKQLLWAYDFYQKPYSTATGNTLQPYLIYLAEKEYRDFRLFYLYIKWYKDNNQANFASLLKNKVLQYALAIPPPTPPGNNASGNSLTQEPVNKMYADNLEQMQYRTLIQQL